MAKNMEEIARIKVTHTQFGDEAGKMLWEGNAVASPNRLTAGTMVSERGMILERERGVPGLSGLTRRVFKWFR